MKKEPRPSANSFVFSKLPKSVAIDCRQRYVMSGGLITAALNLCMAFFHYVASFAEVIFIFAAWRSDIPQEQQMASHPNRMGGWVGRNVLGQLSYSKTTIAGTICVNETTFWGANRKPWGATNSTPKSPCGDRWPCFKHLLIILVSSWNLHQGPKILINPWLFFFITL